MDTARYSNARTPHVHATRARHTRATQTPLTHCQRPPPDSPRQHPSMSAHNAHRRVLGQRVRWLCAGPTLSRARTLHTRTLHTHTHTRCTHAHILYTQRKRDIAPLLTRRPPPDGPRLDGQRVRWCRTEARATQANARSCDTISRCSSCYSLKQLARTSRVRFPIGASAGAGGGAGGAAEKGWSVRNTRI